jgi:hypothetical protein
MREAYPVLGSEAQAAKPCRPLRYVYKHRACGTLTRLADPIARTLAHSPGFYRELYCVHCKSHSWLKEPGGTHSFIWTEDGMPVGE